MVNYIIFCISKGAYELCLVIVYLVESSVNLFLYYSILSVKFTEVPNEIYKINVTPPFGYLCICHGVMFGQKTIISYLVSIWVASIMMIVISFIVGDTSSALTSPHQNKVEYFTKLRFNDKTFTGTMAFKTILISTIY